MYEWMNKQKDEWLDGCMNEWMKLFFQKYDTDVINQFIDFEAKQIKHEK